MTVTDDSIASDVFDHLRKATSADPNELVILYRDYLSEAREALLQLRTALSQKDAEQLSRCAHSLRGSSLVVGAAAVARCCAGLEQMGRDSEFGNTASLLDHASTALDAVEAELVRRLGPSLFPVKVSVA